VVECGLLWEPEGRDGLEMRIPATTDEVEVASRPGPPMNASRERQICLLRTPPIESCISGHTDRC
jgi:hypothetical protein